MVDWNKRQVEEWVPDPAVPIRDCTFGWHLGDDVPPGFIQLNLTNGEGRFRLWFSREQFRDVMLANEWAKRNFGEKP